MTKKYPWQRWPDRKKTKQSNYDGQTQDPSWKDSSIKALIKEEKQASKDYQDMSRTAETKRDSQTIREMSRDEARHAKNLEKMKE